MKAHIVSDFISGNKRFISEYWDVDSFLRFDFKKCRHVSGVCFYNKKIIIVFDKKRNYWGIPGGKPETDEGVEKALEREIHEETNSKVTMWKPVGVQKIIEENGEWFYQYRTCCYVELIDDFVEDPAGTIGNIKFIDPLEYKQYFDWKETGDRIIGRSLELVSMVRR